MDLLLKPEEKLILLGTDICPDKTGMVLLDEIVGQIDDWNMACRLLIDRAAAPLFLNLLSSLENASFVPSPVLNRLQQASLKTRARNAVLVAHFKQIVESFTREKIPVIALKGVFLSEWLYGDLGLRQFSDLDLLVPSDLCSKAIEVLGTMGYESDSLRPSQFISEHSFPSHEPPMYKNGVSVEIHRSIHAANESYCVDSNDLWRRAVPVTLHGSNVLMLSPEDQLLHICLHLNKHFRTGRFQFTCLYDLANLINHKRDLINWPTFIEYCRQYGTEQCTYKYLSFVSLYMNVCLPEAIEPLVRGACTRKDLKKINDVLHGSTKTHYFGGVSRTLGTMDKLSDRWHYLFDLFFPSKDFMMKRYRLKKSYQLLWFYPYRILKVFVHLKNAVVNSIKY